MCMCINSQKYLNISDHPNLTYQLSATGLYLISSCVVLCIKGRELLNFGDFWPVKYRGYLFFYERRCEHHRNAQCWHSDAGQGAGQNFWHPYCVQLCPPSNLRLIWGGIISTVRYSFPYHPFQSTVLRPSEMAFIVTTCATSWIMNKIAAFQFQFLNWILLVPDNHTTACRVSQSFQVLY